MAKDTGKFINSPIGSEILWLACINDDYLTFIVLVNTMLDRSSKEGKQKRSIKILLDIIFGTILMLLLILQQEVEVSIHFLTSK